MIYTSSIRLCSQRLKFLHMVHEDNCIALRSSGSIYKHGMNIHQPVYSVIKIFIIFTVNLRRLGGH